MCGFCNVWVCVCVGFVMCGCVYVWVLYVGGELESRCVGRVYGADGAVLHPHRTHGLRSSSEDHHPSTNSVQKTICCNSTSNAPDDGRMYPKHAELRIYQ